jgi:hypothetical protein
MEAEIAEVEIHASPVQDDQSRGGITEVQSSPGLPWGGLRYRGPGSNWVQPWLKTTNSSTCPYHCDGFELRMV